MAILDMLLPRRSAPRNSIENPAVPISSEEVLKILGIDGTTTAGVNVTERKAMGYPPFWRGVNTLSGDLAKVPIQVMRRGAETENAQRARQHPAYRLLKRKPGPLLKPFTWKKAMFQHALVRGNGYSYIHRSGGLRGGEPVALTLLPPTPTTTPVYHEEEKQLYYHTILGGVDYRFRAEDVIHIQGISLDGILGLEGVDVLTVMKEALSIQLAQQKHVAKFFGRETRTVGFLTAPGRLQDKQLKDIKEGWAKMQTSIDDAHSAALLTGGLTFQSLGIDPEKAQLQQAREFGQIETAHILGMPPHKLGSSVNVSYKSLEQENTSYLESTLDQWFVLMEEELEDKLLTEDEKDADEIYIEFNRKALLRVDFAGRIAGYRRLRGMGVLNANQIAGLENLPLQGTAGDRYLLSGSWSAIGDDGMPVNSVTSSAPAMSDQAKRAHVAAIADVAGQVLRAESRRLTNASIKSSDDVMRWVLVLLDEIEEKLSRALQPAVHAYYASRGDGVTPDLKVLCMGAAKRYVTEAFDRVDDAIGATKNLGDDLSLAADGWEGRAEEIANWLCA